MKFILQKQLSFPIIPLAEKMGKPVPDKLRKQFSIYIPFIRKTLNHTSAMGNDNHKLGHTFYNPFFLALGTAFLMHLSLSFSTCKSLVTLLVVVNLSCGPNQPHQDKNDILSVQKFSSNALHFQANFIHVREGLQWSGDPLSCILVPIAMLMQDTSDDSSKLCIHVDSLLNICQQKRANRSP